VGTTPVWTRSRVLIVTLGLAILFYAFFLMSVFLHIPGDGYGIHLSKNGFTVDRAVVGGALQKNDSVIGIADDLHEWKFGSELSQPGVWQHRLFGRTLPAVVNRTYILTRDGNESAVKVEWTRANLANLISRTGILFLLGLAFVFNGLFITLRRGEDWIGQLMALALLTEGLNLINNTINLFSINVGVSYYWLFAPIDLLSFWATFSLLLHIFLVFPKESMWLHRHPRSVWAIHASNPLISGVGGFIISGGSALAARATIYQLAYPIAGVQLLAALGLMVHAYVTTRRPLIRNQIRWIMWGVAVGAAGWLILYAIPIIFTGNPLSDLAVAMVPLIAVPVSLTFAVTRYRLLEIETIINRSLVYGALSLFLAGVYFASVALISRGLQLLTGRQDSTTAVFLSTLTIAVAFALVRDHFQQIIDRAFYRSKLNFQQLLHQVSRELSTTLVPGELISLLTETIPQRLELNGAALFVLDTAEEIFVPYGTSQPNTTIPRTQELENQLTNEGILLSAHKEDESPCFHNVNVPGLQVCLPLFSRGRLIGLYGFGPKLSGDSYNSEEIQILRTLSHQVAISVENTRLYHQVQVHSESLEELVRQRTSELEQAHEKAAAERNKLDAILKTIADGLVVTDVQGHIVLTNPVFDRIVGQPAAKLTGLPLSDAIADARLQTMVEQALTDGGQVLSGDLTLDQQVFRASACALRAEASSPMTSSARPSSEVVGAVTILRDVTHEVAVDRMKTDFISVVSHELRTPLTSVVGFAKLIRRNFDREIVPALPTAQKRVTRAATRITENLNIIESESLRLTRLINDVLDIAKMESGKTEWRREELDPVQVIRSAVAGSSALAQEKGMPVVLELFTPKAVPSTGKILEESLLPALWGDFDRLVQVMTNLLSNAIKFTDQGQITVRSQLWETGQPSPGPLSLTSRLPSPAILISVTDTGIGIDPHNLSTLFEKFKQVGDALTDRPKGTGLGLAICKEIVEHHGGTIWAESELGVGSTFTVALPAVLVRHPPASEESLREIQRRIAEHVPATDNTHPLILVVDDEPNIRHLLKLWLTDAGYRVTEAADGVQALAEARRQRPDLIILDVMMPGVSGFDVTSVLKADERTADIPILILSIIEDRQRGLRLGADEYLTKPVNTEDLLQTIADLLSGLHAEGVAPSAKPSDHRKKVLVVDDDTSVIETITHALHERGFEVVEAYDPRGAIERADTEKPDLIILDAVLSQMNDYALLKALRYRDHEQRLNIIVLSGEMSPHDRTKWLDQALNGLGTPPASDDLK